MVTECRRIKSDHKESLSKPTINNPINNKIYNTFYKINMYMLNKIKQIGSKIKEQFQRKSENQNDIEDSSMSAQYDQSDKDFVRRKITFDEDVQFNLGIESTSDLKESMDEDIQSEDNQDDEKHLKLKRLFKSRAKKLIERAESLTTGKIDSILGDYNLDKVEEEKEMIKFKSHESRMLEFRKYSSISSSQKFDIKIDLDENKEPIVSKQLEEIKEDVKGESDITKEEYKKSCEERPSVCGLKRAKSFNHREELERNLKDFTCTICMDYMVGAKQLQCGHCFCDQCISFWFLREKVCPICRDRVREEKTIDCNLIDFTIEHILVRTHYKDSTIKKEANNWHKRRQKYIKWKESHKVSKCKIGDKIDVRDTEYIWCVGTIEKILKSKYNCANLLFVHYEGWNRCYDEFIPADSERIAPLKLYTSRTDIPKYTRHEGQEDRIYGNVIEEGDRVPPPIIAAESSDSDGENNNENQEILNGEGNQEENVNSSNQEVEPRIQQHDVALEQNLPNEPSIPRINLNQIRPPTRPSLERIISRISVPLRISGESLHSIEHLLAPIGVQPPVGILNRNSSNQNSNSSQRPSNNQNSQTQNQQEDRQDDSSI